ncbi:MAG: DUF748 domain-containing protein [Bacteroidales bacterium]
MKIANTKLKKTIIIVSGIILTAIVVIIVLISPIAKYLIEKYDEKYTGRKIELGWVYVNPFTGYIHLSGLTIYELKSSASVRDADVIFFSAQGLSANFAMHKLLSKTIEISEIILDQPKGTIIQEKKELNFADLIKKFTPAGVDKTPSNIRFNILRIVIHDGEFHYREKLIPINYFIKKVNIESDGKRWNSDSITAKFSFLPGIGTGDVKGKLMINFKTVDYRLAIVVRKFDLNIIQQYLKDLTNNGSFSAYLDATIKARGNFKDQEDLNASGVLSINDFHFGKNPNEDYASFDNLVLAMRDISPKLHHYLFDSVSLSHPFLKYERYDYLDNIQTMFGKNGVNLTAATTDVARFNLIIEIARYVKVLAKNFFTSNYKINRLGIYRADLQFNDYAVSEKFSVALDPLYIVADSIEKDQERVHVLLKSGIKPYGNVSVMLSINPKDSTDFDLQYVLQGLSAAMFNPYIITFTSYPLDRGTIELKGAWWVRSGHIESNNHVIIIDPRRTGRVRNKDKNWLPLPLIMSLIRERGNVIDYEIPITGNLKDPKFHLHDVLVDLVENIFVKPATTSYRMEVKNTESEIEQSLTLKWEMRKSLLSRNQDKFVARMVDYLEQNKEATLWVYPMPFVEKEKEYTLFFEAKKKYYLLIHPGSERNFSEEDSAMVDKMSVKDSVFVHYLNKLANGHAFYTIQEKCSNFVGDAFIDRKLSQLVKAREMAFMVQFIDKGVANRVIMHPDQITIPFNGFSYYKIRYKGELPRSLVRAHRKMNDLDNEKPRNKYMVERKKKRL